MYLVKCKDSIMSVENIYNLVLEKEVPKKKKKKVWVWIQPMNLEWKLKDSDF